MMDRIVVSTDRRPLAEVDAVIEAIVEDEAAKTDLFHGLTEIVPESAILASNTSTIPISRMARSVSTPRRFAGMHFFNPVDRMKLIEVIRGEATDDQTTAALTELARRLGKTPIVVNDCPGFLVTRLLFHYLREALYLLEEGTPMDAIDRTAVAYGMPMGPIALMDLIGLDVVEAIFNVMAAGYPGRVETSPLLTDLVRMGRLGRKSGTGFRISDAPPRPPTGSENGDEAQAAAAEESRITDRLFLATALEATRILDEGIVQDPADVDTGLLLGLGFPAARGGLLRWCDSLGAREVLRRVEQLEGLGLGARFEPTERLRRTAAVGGAFRSPE